jgi:putative spermidine/putrescine transport system ATP-binding protein
LSFIEIRGFGKAYGATQVFTGVELDVAEGEMCILLGPSGCGKTTLLRAIAGLVRPDCGRLVIAGRDVTAAAPEARGIAMVFQHYALFPNMTVRQNLAFGLQQKRLPRAQVAAKLDAALALMELTPRADARPAELSGGQKQRVALARALVLEPRLLLLDEPLSALDAQIRKRLRDELKRLQRETGFTAILVTHDQEEALVLGDQVAVMNAGRIVQAAPAREVYDRPATRFIAGFIGDFNLLEPDAVLRVFGELTDRAWAVHPEAIDLVSPAAGQGGLTTEATVTDIRIHGPVLRYLVSAHGTELKVDVLNRSSIEAWRPGSAVRLCLDRSQIREIA